VDVDVRVTVFARMRMRKVLVVASVQKSQSLVIGETEAAYSKRVDQVMTFKYLETWKKSCNHN